MVLIYFFFASPNQLTGRERISPEKRCEKVFTEFPLHISALYGSTPYLLKNETVVQLILTCKSKCKGLFRSRRACKHHRKTQCKLAHVKPRFFHFIYHALISIAHSCEVEQCLVVDNTLVKISTVICLFYFFSQA